ncbi:hypothetical protein L2U69_11235 [Zavarzinia compransoris]|uniref:hypothetical protein n=1 Tax=Zavarzinia marina TaxID=2911065 RepID=UPI001F17934C|nr:hypothetical protein [Zavarzinia marina]MCF4166219.1 hypothetical protein [Zavarzinia marina]
MPAELTVVTVSSVVAAPRAAVWAHVSTFEGVNDELGPLVRMSHPATTAVLDESLPLDRPLFRSWLLLFGVLPVDYDHIGFAHIAAGSGFAERSTMGSLKVWHHDRRLEDVPGGTRVTDRLAFAPRLPGTAGVARRIVGALFRHRHRRLARRFGAIAAP